MNNLFQNKFFISFLILAVVIYGLSVKIAQASGVFNWLSYLIVTIVAVFMPLLLPMLLGTLTTVAELGIISGFIACQFGNDNAFWEGCGDISGIIIPAPMLIPFGKGECRVGLVLPSFYEPWPGQSVGVATTSERTTMSDYTSLEGTGYYANYLSNDVNKLGGEYNNLPLSEVRLADNLPNNGFVIEYEKSPRTFSSPAVYASTTIPQSMSMNQFRQNYGEIILKTTESSNQFPPTIIISTSTPEQFIKFGTFFSTSTQSGYKVSKVSDVVISSGGHNQPPVCSAPRTETDSNCDLLFQPKGQTKWYPVVNYGSTYGDAQRASYPNRPIFRATRIIPPPLVEDDFDVELYRFAKTFPTAPTSQQLLDWLMPGDYSGSNQAAFNRTAGLGVHKRLNMFERKAYTRHGDTYNYYPSPPDAEQTTPIFTAKYKNVCASGRCNLIDSNPIEGKYLAYEAKIKGNFGEFYSNLERTIVPAQAKYLNTKSSGADSKFSTFLVDDGDLIYNQTGNILYGPLSPITLPPEDACEIQAQVRIVAVKCDSILISVVVPLADQNNYSGYDVFRDGSLVAANVPIAQSLFEDKGLAKRTSYSYKVVLKTTDNASQEYNLSSVKTLCPPECGFSANPNQLVFPQGDTRISWDCDDADSCSLSATALPQDLTLSQFCQKNSGSLSENVCQVSPVQGTSQNLTLDQTTTFILSCQNQDGAAVKTATVDFLRPKRIEVIPR